MSLFSKVSRIIKIIGTRKCYMLQPFFFFFFPFLFFFWFGKGFQPLENVPHMFLLNGELAWVFSLQVVL